MKNYRTHKSGLFLIELILAITFFSLASAVCLQLFVKSHLLSQETTQLNTGINLATSIAEIFRQNYGDMEAVQKLMPELKPTNSENHYIAFYKEEGLPCQKADAFYTLTMENSEIEGQHTTIIKILSVPNHTSIYELSVQVHLPNTP